MATSDQSRGASTRSPSDSKDGNAQAKMPILCLFWISVQRSLPPIHFLGLDVSLSIASAIFLGILRYLAELILISWFGWPYNSMDTKLAASSVSSICHSTCLVSTLFLLLATVARSYNPSSRMVDEQAGQWWNECVRAMLQFCTGYMIYDAAFTILWLKLTMQEGGINAEDMMFLGHHVVTALYMSSTRWIQAGHQSAMVCMFLGELTNPLHNAFYIGQLAQKYDCCNGKRSQAMFSVVEFLFGFLYTLVRAVVAPIVFVHMTYNLLTQGFLKVREIPGWLVLLWLVLIWGVELGSIPWIVECWGFVMKHFPTTELLKSLFLENYNHAAYEEL